MQGTQLFFQIAAGLIPAFLFAGVLSEGVKPPTTWMAKPSANATFIGLVLLGYFSVFAEVAAIRGALGAGLGEVDVWVVVIALVGGTGLLVLRALWPWLSQLWPIRPAGRRTAIVIVVGLGVFLLGTAVTMRSSVDLASALAQFEESKRELAAGDRSLAASKRKLADDVIGPSDTYTLIDAIEGSHRKLKRFERQLGTSGTGRSEAHLLLQTQEAEVRAALALVRDPSPLTSELHAIASKRSLLARQQVAQEAQARGEPLPAGVRELLKSRP